MQKADGVPLVVSLVPLTGVAVRLVARLLAKRTKEPTAQEEGQAELDEEVLLWCHAEWFEDLDYSIDSEVCAWWEQETAAPGPIVDYVDPELYRMWAQATDEDPRDYMDEEIHEMYLQDVLTPERHGPGWAQAAVAPSPLSAAGAIGGRAKTAHAGRSGMAATSAKKVRQARSRRNGLVQAIFVHG